ncbi:MAG: citramalate synthase [Anaerolineae bacterium]|nr:citramalate synthase [Anaerolineae bacterium]
MDRIILYDTTLRDGAQQEGISFSLDDKIKVARRLDRFGVHYIEGGWPGSNPKDVEFFQAARHLHLENAVLTAFGSTCRASVAAEDDANLRMLLEAETPAVAIFGKSWDLHVFEVLRTTLDNNLRMIEQSVALLRSHGREVIFDAEHFFDGYKANPEYALETLQAAVRGGASTLVLCDTNGGSLVAEVSEITKRVRQTTDLPIGIHCHNDGDLAVANTLAAVEAGATHLQGTINGYGERCGNANLCTIIPSLQLKMGRQAVSPESLAHLTDLSRYVAELANMAPSPTMPYVGTSAFAHKGGMHVDAMMKTERSFQHVDPELVGNHKRILVSELSGRSNILRKAQEFGLAGHLDEEALRAILERIKGLESRGFAFEGAEGSVELMMLRALDGYRPPFELVDFMVLVERRRGRGLLAEATVKLQVNGDTFLTAAEGEGPVNALDQATRKALVPLYPQLASVHLTDFKVRILNEASGTAAVTRVLIDSTDGYRKWTTVGSSANIIEASWIALADSLEYALVKGLGRREVEEADERGATASDEGALDGGGSARAG